jgi:hypothetical protein
MAINGRNIMRSLDRSGYGPLYNRFQKTPNGWTGWNDEGWQSLGGTNYYYNKPSAASNEDGRLEVFMDGEGGLYHTWQTFPNNGWWDGT